MAGLFGFYSRLAGVMYTCVVFIFCFLQVFMFVMTAFSGSYCLMKLLSDFVIFGLVFASTGVVVSVRMKSTSAFAVVLQ